MNDSVEFLYLSQEDVLATGIDMLKVIDTVEEVLGLHEDGKVNLPSKVILDLGERERGRINAMPAYVGGEFEMCGMKWIAGFPPNPAKYGIPRAHALIVLNDAETGVPLAVMDGTYISATPNILRIRIQRLPGSSVAAFRQRRKLWPSRRLFPR
jgi:ornithine cyclodeaminase